jgi:N-acetylmuramoyl-L-alanine amidase
MPITSPDMTTFTETALDAARGNVDAESFTSALSESAFGFFDDIFDDIFDSVTGIIGDILTGGPDAILGVIDRIIADLGGTLTPEGIIDSFVPEDLLPTLDIPIPGLVDGEGNPITPRDQFTEAFLTNNTEQAVQTLVPFTGIDVTDQEQVDAITEGLTSAFDLITVTRAGEIIVDRSNLALPPVYDIKSTFGTNSPGYTSFISSVEELQLEFRSVLREIVEVIIHSTETHTNANLDADQIKETAIEFGASEMPYHYVIKRDGSLQRGLDVDTVADHCPENGHNDRSISLILVGGLNIATGVSADDEFTQAAAYTREQYNTLWHFMKTFFNTWPGGQALGHGDVLGYRNEPGFDVREYCKSEFNKISLYKDPVNEYAFSSTDINRSIRFLNNRAGLAFAWAWWDKDALG